MGIQIVPKLENVRQLQHNVRIYIQINRGMVLKWTFSPNFYIYFRISPCCLLQTFQKNLNNFIWNNKRPRLRLSLLYLPYDRGGLRCPNLLWYFRAVQLRMFYFITDGPLTWKDEPKKLTRLCSNPIVKNMIGVWQEVNKYLKEPPPFLLLPNLWQQLLQTSYSRCWYQIMGG